MKVRKRSTTNLPEVMRILVEKLFADSVLNLSRSVVTS
jgi:hypothetical protein